MSAVYSFRCKNENYPALDSVLVIFFAPGSFSNDVLSEEITKQTAVNLTPDFVAVLISSDDHMSVDGISDTNEAFVPLADRSSVGLYGYDGTGSVKYLRTVIADPPETVDLGAFVRQGLTNLARKRDVILNSGPTAHFIKPSGEGDRRFLRASLALSDAGEIFFMALCLLPHVGEEVSVMHIDTSAISSLALAVSIMKKLPAPMNVKTFASYGGISSHDFNPDRSEVVVISASQSGNLGFEVSKRVGKNSKVITLFSAGPISTVGPTICDLNFHGTENPKGIRADGSTKRNLSSSRPIRLVGDQFHAEISPSISVIPGLPCSPKKLQSLIQSLAGMGAFSGFKKGQDGTERRSIWINSSAILKSGQFKSWISEILLKDIPSQIREIVFLPSSDISERFAELIRDEINRTRATGSKVRTLSVETLEGGSLPPVNERVCVLIAGGVTGHGEDLLVASRALRDYAPNSHRVFVSLATIPSTSESRRFLSSNLTMPSHKFLSMLDVIIDRKRSAEAWELEQRILQDYTQHECETLTERREALESPNGLTNDLFLGSHSGPLRLRNNFAFWEGEIDYSKVSQADVFLAILVVLENMRTNDELDSSRRLVNSTQVHTVISAGAFARFNDGVIQASLLRAALAVELNYLHSPRDSGLMAEFLCGMIRHPKRHQAEALTEFLLSLASGRLCLIENDLNKVRSCGAASSSALNCEQRFFLKLITDGAKAEDGDMPF